VIFSLEKYMGEIVSEKFFIKHDNIALLVNTMAGRLSEWSGCLSEIMMNFDDFSSSEGFTGNSANAAREYCATYYGCNGASSLPILLSESAVAISEALLLYEKTFLDFDTVEKFSISEEEIDYIIQDAGVEAIGDFETIHENAINIINSISDIVELPKPDDTYYIQDSEDIVSQLEEVKEDIYELEAAELVKIEELNEQIDSLLALVESYSNKTKRATSFVSSDEIITSELDTAIEEYAKSCQRRQLNAANLEAAKAQHAATMERIQKEFEERRKKQGEQKIWHGIFAATVGTLCIVCTAGAASPVVIGAGLTFGTGSLLYGDSYIQEGEEDIYYASIGDINTPASNYIRDSIVFKGNQELYDLWGSINVSGAMSMIPVGLKGSGVLRSSVNMTSSSLATETRFVVYDTIASESASFGVGEYCDYKGIEGTDKLMLQSAASFVTSLGLVKASEIGQGAEQITKVNYDDLPREEAVFRLDDAKINNLDVIENRPIDYYKKEYLETTLNSEFSLQMPLQDRKLYLKQQKELFFDEFQERATRLGMDSSQTVQAFDALMDGDYVKMASYFDSSTPVDKAFFWSGCKETAAKEAASVGGKTLEMTQAGLMFDNWETFNNLYDNWRLSGPVWETLSSQYAEGARGLVTRFYTESAKGVIWNTIELPKLIENSDKGLVTKIIKVKIDG
jgi:hypothetical protein